MTHEDLKNLAPDCGDNSCLFGGRGKGGMRTNGGCRCLSDVKPETRRYFTALQQEVEMLRTQAAQSRQEALEQLSSKLQERAQWLRKEYLNGGSYEHLAAREQECTYIATDMILALKQHMGEDGETRL